MVPVIFNWLKRSFIVEWPSVKAGGAFPFLFEARNFPSKQRRARSDLRFTWEGENKF
jgi:hypothetical protein